jgi:AcrR family transcriptional regulator
MSWADTLRRRPYHVGNLRSQLMTEARALLETGGRSELSLRALAARAGIAPGSVYHHYASKSALLAELATAGFKELEVILRAAMAPGPGATPIRTSALAYFGFSRAQPALYELMFDPCLMSEEVAAARESAFGVLKAAIAASPNQRDADPDTIHKVALAVFACGHGAASMAPPDGGEASMRLMEDVIQGLEALFRRQ